MLLRHCVSVLRVSDQQSTVCHEDPCKPLHIAADVTLHSTQGIQTEGGGASSG